MARFLQPMKFPSFSRFPSLGRRSIPRHELLSVHFSSRTRREHRGAEKLWDHLQVVRNETRRRCGNQPPRRAPLTAHLRAPRQPGLLPLSDRSESGSQGVLPQRSPQYLGESRMLCP
ncbi:hypothetical protein AOLI_G00224470 [Acnodon oligacanthus]